MSRFSKIISRIKRNKENPTEWIPLRYGGLASHVGITKKLYHLIGGDPGTGKTSFVDQTYVLDAHDWAQRNPDVAKLKTIYFSMERSKEYKELKWLAHRLWTQDEILVDVPTLDSWGTAKHEVTDELIQVAESHDEYFDRLYQDVEIIDGIENPTGIYKKIKTVALKHGTLYKRRPDGKYYKVTHASWMQKQKGVKQTADIAISPADCPKDDLQPGHHIYVQHDPKLILQVVLDHMTKPRPERGFNAKQTVDKTSEYLSVARDTFGMSVVAISQFNRANANIQRRLNTDLSPEQQDFKQSGNTYEDADVVFGLFNPHKHGVTKHKGYIVKNTVHGGHSRFRSVTLMKNSYGIDNLVAGFLFLGECGFFYQVGKPDDNFNYEVFNV